MSWDGVHWDIRSILPYQRNFNFVNSVRRYGKTYSALDYALKRFEDYGEEIVYFVRKVSELKNASLWEAIQKVWIEQHPHLKLEYKKDILYSRSEDDVLTPVGYTLCLKHYDTIKRKSYPKVRTGIFDEYVKEEGITEYVNGWKEPDLILNLYDTIDRAENKVKMFFFANHITPFNPYHMHPVFRIPQIPEGEVWKRPNILYSNEKPNEKFLELQKNNAFLNMVKGSSYDAYANKAKYLLYDSTFVKKRTPKAKLQFNIGWQGMWFGIWVDWDNRLIFIDDKYNLGIKINFALTNDDHREGTVIGKRSKDLKWLIDCYKHGEVYYVSEKVKAKAEAAIRSLL